MRSLEAFRAELAEIILFGSDENPSLRTLVGPGSHRELMEPVDSDGAVAMRSCSSAAAAARLRSTPRSAARGCSATSRHGASPTR
jgi:hypothetical protein